MDLCHFRRSLPSRGFLPLVGLLILMSQSTFAQFGGFDAAIAVPSGGDAPHAALVTDFDHDGDKDILVANDQSSVMTLLRNDGGSFVSAGNHTVDSSPKSAAAADQGVS